MTPLRKFAAVVALVSVGCGGAAPPPATVAQRTPDPKSVTRDNPAGDAESPEDSALARMLKAPFSGQSDKFNTYLSYFPDGKNWRRTRFWGVPTRGAFRYGKDRFAIGVLLYEESRSDFPKKCLERVVDTARAKAATFDLAVSNTEWMELTHIRGVESVDWERHELEEAAKRARQKKLREVRKQHVQMLRLRIKKRRTQRRGNAPEPAEQPTPTLAAPVKGPPSDPKPAVDKDKGEQPAVAEDTKATGKPVVGKPVRVREVARRAPFRVTGNGRRIPAPSRPRGKPKRKPMPTPKPLPASLTVPQRADIKLSPEGRRFLDNYGEYAMPVVIVDAQFETLFNNDRYLAAAVAHRSWTGTCLVQGFAVRVGTDVSLARRVIDRWLYQAAFANRWGMRVREAPAIENR